jgi:hypothetical protein
MTAADDARPLTASAFLFGEDQDSERALAQALDDEDVLEGADIATRLVTRTMRKAAEDQVAVVADGLFDLDLGDLVVEGWRKQERLAAAAERTAANPGMSEVVELATHRISSVHHPYVELLLDDEHLANVNFDLQIEFVIKALMVTVRNGHVVNVHAGACDVAATLAAEGFRLASQQRHYELPLVVRWPLLLRPGDGPGQPPYGAEPPPATPPTPSPRRRSPISHAYLRQRRKRPSPGTPGD